jgi:hypothetical protein
LPLVSIIMGKFAVFINTLGVAYTNAHIYTQYPIIRNGLIKHGAEISENFKKPVDKG